MIGKRIKFSLYEMIDINEWTSDYKREVYKGFIIDVVLHEGNTKYLVDVEKHDCTIVITPQEVISVLKTKGKN